MAGGTKTLHYDVASRLTQEDLPNGIISRYAYDSANRLLGLRHADATGAAIAMSNYKLDSVGNRMSRETVAEKDAYSYDKTYQLTGVRSQWADLEIQAAADPTLKLTEGMTKTASVSYDPIGNRSGYDETYTGGVPALHKAYGYDDANGMTSDGGISQTLDNNGNLVSSNGETRVWDARNRLIGIQTPGQANWSATYAFDNRINERSVGLTQTAFLYDDRGQLWAEVDGQTGKPSKVYGYDAVGLWSEAELRDGKLVPSYPLFDGLGSVLAMTDRQNNVKQTWAYDAFGALSYGNADGGFGYTGRWGGYTDPRAGVLNWNRWYLQEAGRWGSRDQWGIKGSLNLYSYSANRPTGLIDPAGHFPDNWVPDYGNWAGPNWSGGWRPSEHGGQDGPGKPIDDLDALAEAHDHLYESYGFTSKTPNSNCDQIADPCLRELCKLKAQVDRKLMQGARNLSENPAMWNRHPENGPIPSDWYSRHYRNVLINNAFGTPDE